MNLVTTIMIAYYTAGIVAKILDIAERISENKIKSESKNLSFASLEDEEDDLTIKVKATDINNVKTLFRDAADILEDVRGKLFERKHAKVSMIIGSKKVGIFEIKDNLKMVGLFLNRSAGTIVREGYSINYYLEALNEDYRQQLVPLYTAATMVMSKAVHHLEQEDKPKNINPNEEEHERINIPRLNLRYEEQDLALMAILAMHYDDAKIKGIAVYTLKELGIIDFVKEVKDISVATKILNSIFIKRKKFALAKAYTYNSLKSALTSKTTVTKLNDKECFDLGYKFGSTIAYYALR